MPRTDVLNLVPAIYEIKAQIRTIEAEYDAAIKPYKESLAALRKINQACENCCGKGRVLRSRSCAEDDAPDPNDPNDYNTCSVCHGTGLSSSK